MWSYSSFQIVLMEKFFKKSKKTTKSNSPDKIGAFSPLKGTVMHCCLPLFNFDTATGGRQSQDYF